MADNIVAMVGGDSRDDDIRLYVNGTQIGYSVNYDEHGSAGQELMGAIAYDLAKVLGTTVKHINEGEDEDHET